MEPSFTVNKFMFCLEHGSEFCNKCCCDYRYDNISSYNFDDPQIGSCLRLGNHYMLEDKIIQQLSHPNQPGFDLEVVRH